VERTIDSKREVTMVLLVADVVASWF
jgi:hypothetical protein